MRKIADKALEAYHARQREAAVEGLMMVAPCHGTPWRRIVAVMRQAVGDITRLALPTDTL